MNRRDRKERPLVCRAVRALAIAAVLTAGVSANAGAAIVANLESPNSQELASGIGNVQGWAYPTIPGDEIKTEIDVYVDGQLVVQVPCCSDRGDVKQAHPAAPILSGFSGAYNFQSLTPGQHTMQVHVYSKFGDHEILSTTFTSDSLGSYPFNKKLFFDDAKADHCTPSNVVENGETVARFVCSGLEFTNGAGFTEHCAGDIEMTWMRSAQGFRVTKGCDLIDWVKPPFTIEPGLIDPSLIDPSLIIGGF